MENKVNGNVTDLLAALTEYKNQQLSGTIFIATGDNKSCQIVLTKGMPVKAAYGTLKGLVVLHAIVKLQQFRFSFNKNLDFPMSIDSVIDEGRQALEILGYTEFKQDLEQAEDEKVSEPEEVLETVTMYRGQRLVSRKTQKEKPNPMKKTDPVKIYRGRIVN